jgi:hypothetical protein
LNLLLLLLTIIMMVKNDLLGLSLGEKADQFVKKARENPQWAYDILIKYVNHGKHRVNIKKILLQALCKLTSILSSHSMNAMI